MNQPHATDDRWQIIQKLWQENQWLYVLIGVFIGIIFSQLVSIDITEFTQSLMPEAIGIGFTVLILDRIYQGRERNRYKEQLIGEMGSLDNSTALRASEALNKHGWAQDGTLVEAYLKEANLKNIRIDRANLHRANLVGVILIEGKMYHTDFSRVQMSDSDFRNGRFNMSSFENSMVGSTDFRGCHLRGCQFQGASLIGSDFENADLEGADLRGAYLIGANLEGVKFGDHFSGWLQLQMDENTLLPDGQSWHEGVDMERFTDPYHPEFWRPRDFNLLDDVDDSDNPFWWRRQNRKESD